MANGHTGGTALDSNNRHGRVVWRAYKPPRDDAVCYVELTAAGAYSVTVERCAEVKFSAVATDWLATRQMIMEQRDKLLQQGWIQHYP
jgi:hypothetical protein